MPYIVLFLGKNVKISERWRLKIYIGLTPCLKWGVERARVNRVKSILGV